METATDILINMGLVAGLVEAIKRVFGSAFSSERFGPILSLIVGVSTAQVGAYLNWYDATVGEAAYIGLIAGLTASGLYRTVKSPGT